MFKKNYVVIIMSYLTILLVGLVTFSIINSFDFSTKNNKNSMVVKVGTSPDYPPLEFKENNELKGFDIDLVNAIAKDQNLKIEYKEIGFDNLISSIQNKKIDLIASGFEKTPERDKVVDFSIPYLMEKNIIVSNDDQEVTLNEIKDKKIAVLAGSTQFENLKKINATNIKVFDNAQVALKALETKNVDYAYAGISQQQDIDNHKIFKTYIDEQTPNGLGTAFAIVKDNKQLKEKFDMAIKHLYENKTLQKLSIK